MYNSTALRQLVAIALLAVFTAQAAASDEQELENGLMNALKIKNSTTQRVGNSGKAIQAYMRQGLIDKKPNQRVDYTDYYLVNNSAKFMGHELVVIEEEYMSKYIGCCASPGAGVTVKIVGSSKNIEKFAHANRCTFTDHVNLQDELSHVSMKTHLPRGNFASLSCRERDADR